MFYRKKEQQPTTSPQGLHGRYVRVNQNQRGGYIEYGQAYPHVLYNSSQQPPRGIPEVEISESYLSKQDEEDLNKKKNKGNKRKIPFLQKKKKNQSPNISSEQRKVLGNDDDEDGDDDDDNDDDISDITTYDEGIPVAFQGMKINNVNPASFGQYNLKTHKTEQINQYEEEAQIQERLNYIVGNYRQPPAYPGQTGVENGGKSMIEQLLKEKNNLQIRDNASMINYCQVDAPKGLSMEDLTKIIQQFPEESAQGASSNAQFAKSQVMNHKNRPPELPPPNLSRSDSLNSSKDDKLVMRTLSSPISSPRNGFQSGNLSPAEMQQRHFLFQKQGFEASTRPFAKAISEIYPRDYDADYDIETTSSKHPEQASYMNDVRKEDSLAVVYSPRESYVDHPEPDYDLPNDMSYSLNHLEDYETQSALVVSSHFREKSETFVPPSPYMNTEIPEWLQVYSKASPDLDQYLKWEMFRIPELDCWQTMLKRLYMKELEQVVLWFEEYRQSLQQEIERRERELGISRVAMPIIDPRLKKTDV